MANQSEDQTSAQPQEENGQEENAGVLFSPEGCLMITLAFIIDVAGLSEFIPAVGTILSFIADLTGIIFIGGWMFFRSQQVAGTKRAVTRVTRTLRWLRPIAFIGEFLPFVGIAPLWIILVYFELKQ